MLLPYCGQLIAVCLFMLVCHNEYDNIKFQHVYAYLHRFNRKGNTLFPHHISGDEMWISYVNTEMKQQ